MKIAGRYMGDIMRKASMNPYVSAAGIGGLAAGGATLGNIVSGEAAEEGPGRLGLEALGAGALGAVLGARIPGSIASLGRGRRAMVEELQRQNAGQAGTNPQKEELREAARRISKGAELGNQASIALGTLGAGGLGGMLGGAVGNVGQLVGIPGLQQNAAMQMAAQQAIDPESYGSSNSAGARYKAPTTQYV